MTVYDASGNEYFAEKHGPPAYIVICAMAVFLACGIAVFHHDSKPSPELTISTASGTLTAGNAVMWFEKWDPPVLRAPKDAPPSRIRVGPFTYTVRYTSEEALMTQNALALTMLDEREIWLNPRRKSDLRADILHELLHCSKNLSTVNGRLQPTGLIGEEATIVMISDGLLEILQDNPALREWLARK